MLLAQLPVEPFQVFGFLAAGGALLWIYNEGRRAFSHTPPLHKEYVTKSDAEALKAEVDKIDAERRTSVANLHAKLDAQVAALRCEIRCEMGEIRSDMGEMRKEMKADNLAVHNRITEVLGALRELKGKVQA